MFTPNLLLLLIFPVGGVIMVIAGILTITRLYGNRSVEVDAEKPCTFVIAGEGVPVSCSVPYTAEDGKVLVNLPAGGSFDIQF